MFLLMLEQQLQKGTLPRDDKIQENLKKLEYHEKGQYLSLISESETHILYRFIAHRVKYVKPLFLETPADNMAAQIITDCVNLTLDFKQHGFCVSPLFLNGPVLFLRSPGKMFLTMFLFQKWLGSSFPEDV